MPRELKKKKKKSVQLLELTFTRQQKHSGKCEEWLRSRKGESQSKTRLLNPHPQITQRN